jgi:hypothetical protein
VNLSQEIKYCRFYEHAKLFVLMWIAQWFLRKESTSLLNLKALVLKLLIWRSSKWHTPSFSFLRWSLPILFYAVHRAMGGQVLFQDALAARLNIIKPSKSDVANFLKTKNIGNNSNGLPTQRLTPGVQELIDLLHAKGKIVYLVSGGFRQVMPHVVVAVPFGKTVVLYLCLCVS